MPDPVLESANTLDVAELAARVKASRAEFESVFDDHAKARKGASSFKAIVLRRQRREPLASGPERDAADMRVALEHAAAHDFLAEICAAAGDRLFNTNAAGTILPTLLATDAESRQSVALTYQAIASAGRFHNMDEVQASLMRAQRRTCRIVVRQDVRRVTGSGFLIGPRLVLTNWHVVQSLLEPLPASPGLEPAEAWQVKSGSADALSVEFDLNAPGGKTSVAAAADWLVAASRSEGAGGGGAGDTVKWPTTNVKAAFEPFDDFAVLKISEAAGLERGYYDITGTEPPQELTGRVVLVQYPGAFSIRMSEGSFDVDKTFARLLGSGADATDARVLHNANSIGGSSGGLILDSDMRPVALHQAGLKLGRDAVFSGAAGGDGGQDGQPPPGSTVNVAIPLRRIWKKAGPAIQASLGDLKALRPQLKGGEPLIGRMELQQAIAEAMAGKVKIIVVRPGRGDDGLPLGKVGKSFSLDILRDYLDPAGHLRIEISAAKLVRDPVGAATAILTAVRPGLSIDPSRMQARPQSSELNDVLPAIGADLREKLVAEAGNRILWLIIDDLERHALPNTSTRELLERLYGDVIREPSLRVVLVGLMEAGLAPLQNSDATRFEKPLEHLSRAAIASWLVGRLDGRLALPDAVRDCIAGVVDAVAESRKNTNFSKTHAVAELIRKDVDPPLKRGLDI